MQIFLLILFIFLTFLMLYIIHTIVNFHYRYPKGYKQNIISPKKISMHSTQDLPQKIDTIIIGSGISGLSAASALARSGQTVVVIEQHSIPGGWTHTYQVKGYTFDTGVHWIAQGSNAIFNLIGAKPFEWTRLDHENNKMTYYTRVINGKEYQFPSDLNKVKEMLINNFPHEEKGIKEYFSDQNIQLAIKTVNTYFLYNFTHKLPLISKLTKYIYNKNEQFRKITVQQKFDELFQDNNLKLLLLQSLSTQGLNASNCSYAFHLFLFNHFKDGIVYPSKGSEYFAKNALNVILRYNNSRIILNKKVVKILYDEKQNKVYGVELNNGQQILAQNIIATNSYLMTMERFLNIQNQQILNNLNELKKIVTVTSSLIYIFVGIKGNQNELQLPTEMYSFQNTDASMIAESLEQIFEGKTRVFLNFSSIKQKNQPENKISCELFLNCNYKIFEKWQNQELKNRDQDYQHIKQKLADYLIENYLMKQFPQLIGKIDYIEVGTPLSCEYFLNYPTGSSYGFLNDETKKEIANFKYLSYKCEHIKGLFFAGQDISGGGLFQSCLGGILSASYVLGYMKLLVFIFFQLIIYVLKDILTFRYFFKDLSNIIKDQEKNQKKKKVE